LVWPRHHRRHRGGIDRRRADGCGLGTSGDSSLLGRRSAALDFTAMSGKVTPGIGTSVARGDRVVVQVRDRVLGVVRIPVVAPIPVVLGPMDRDTDPTDLGRTGMDPVNTGRAMGAVSWGRMVGRVPESGFGILSLEGSLREPSFPPPLAARR